MKNINKQGLEHFYRLQIENNFFPYWNKAVDRQNGGIFNCFDNSGTKLVSKNKYTWSQGRFVWIWSRLYELSEKQILTLDMKSLREDLERTVRFLERHVFLQNGNCVFLMDETGNWTEGIPGEGFDTSFYADCFIVLGFSEYARVFGDRHFAHLALDTYRQIHTRVKQGNLRSEPYPIPRGYKFHSVPMIMLNVSEELALTLELLGDERCQDVDRNSRDYMDEIIEMFYYDEKGRVVETRGNDSVDQGNVLCRHFNPGHAIEDMWFVMDLAGRKNGVDYIDKAARGVKSAIRIGWDNEFGGLLRFTDAEGGEPKGKKTGGAYETLILDSWDMKLWWPHSEMLYATLLAYLLTKDEEFIPLYDMAHKYAFETFPDNNNGTGEWVQIRDRRGNPVDRVAALPVKDPYHILRDMILIMELLTKK